MAFTTVATAVLLLALATSAVGSKVKFNVTEMLSEFPEFSTFNNLLSQTKLADEINRHQTVTVLVVDNSAASAITSLPAETQTKVLAVHVIMGYYDPVELDSTKNKTALFMTLFQASGATTDRAGFLNFTEGADDQMEFSSAEPGAPLSSKLVKVVASRPYNISVMQISDPIMPPSAISRSGSGKGNAQLAAPAKANVLSVGLAPSKKTEATEGASAPATEDAEASAQSSQDASAPAAGASSPPEMEKSTDSTADEPRSAGNRVVAGVSVGLVRLMMLVI